MKYHNYSISYCVAGSLYAMHGTGSSTYVITDVLIEAGSRRRKGLNLSGILTTYNNYLG